MKTFLYCSIICFISIYASCRKPRNCKETAYVFEAFYKAYPDKDSIRIGDTIWLELNTPTQLKDLMSNTMVDYSGAGNLGTAIGYGEILVGDAYNPGGIPAANSFDNILIHGETVKSISPDQIREYLFEERNGTYMFKLGIVPRKKGLFALAPSSAANVFRNRDKCTKASFNLTFKDTDQHLYLYEQNRPGYTPSGYEREHMYCFVVY